MQFPLLLANVTSPMQVHLVFEHTVLSPLLDPLPLVACQEVSSNIPSVISLFALSISLSLSVCLSVCLSLSLCLTPTLSHSLCHSALFCSLSL